VFLLDERIFADGTHVLTHAAITGEGDAARVQLHEAGRMIGELRVPALIHVLAHYGRELDPEVLAAALAAGAFGGDALELGGEIRVRRFRHHAPVDATGRDYLVLERPGQPRLAVIATMAASALRYIVLRVASESGSGVQLPETPTSEN
jgi:hypothetical protein